MSGKRYVKNNNNNNINTVYLLHAISLKAMST